MLWWGGDPHQITSQWSWSLNWWSWVTILVRLGCQIIWWNFFRLTVLGSNGSLFLRSCITQTGEVGLDITHPKKD